MAITCSDKVLVLPLIAFSGLLAFINGLIRSKDHLERSLCLSFGSKQPIARLEVGGWLAGLSRWSFEKAVTREAIV
eukprot:6473182-Amphidinium_carterae.2